MYIDNKILMGKSENEELFIVPSMANRHGLITGASGSGKTITLKVMAESFSSMGVPVFLADIKGDLAGTCMPGEASEKVSQRLANLGIENFEFKGFPTVFWDVFGRNGHPIRTPIQSVDTVILSRMLGLNETQAGVLAIVFRIARENNYEIIDTKDLRLVLQYVAENAKDYTIQYGNVAAQSVGTIQRALLKLEEQGGDYLFGEPGIDMNDLLKINENGMGNINILHAVELYQKPDLYATFLLWILSTLNSTLPEVGDMDKPKVVFFFDEAHLLFNEIPSDMLDKVIQIVKLIRSKGVGLYFISQSPADIPNEILAQLGNKVQHTLRAYTPQDQKVIKAVADSYRTNPAFNTEEAIMALGTGEAVVSFLNEKGEPNIVNKGTILPPQSMMGALDDSMRLMIINRSEFKGKYDTTVDRESAYEIISKNMEEAKAQAEQEKQEKENAKLEEQQRKEEERLKKEEEKAKKEEERARKEAEKEAEKKRKNSWGYKVEKQAGRTANSALNSLGRKVINELFKSFFKKK
ncbi:MAG: DUF853 family protein [Clostridia bacterium]|nr:DUF853 family protein [Clostridia bacterium]